MNEPASVGGEDVPPYEVDCLELDTRLQFAGHHHVTLIETRDPDGGRTQWSCVQAIAAIRDGERFVVAEDGHGKLTLLEPGLCPQCPSATLLVDPPEAKPIPCGQCNGRRGSPK